VTYDDAFRIIISEEGGFSDIRTDPGNWTSGQVGKGQLKGTKFGIASHVYPDLDIRNLTLEQAKEIYKRDYWNRVRGDDLPWPLVLYLFDSAVNQGPATAIVMLQTALGVRADGVIGPITLAAAKTATSRQMARYMAVRAQRYFGTCNFDIFGTGWLTRLFVVAQEGAHAQKG